MGHSPSEPERQLEHLPVMSAEVIEALAVRSDGWYVDCTFGRGGHSKAIMARLGREGRLLAFDKDGAAVTSAEAAALAGDERFSIVQTSFAALSVRLKTLGWSGKVDGILMDLGVSSPQLENAVRGFSFMRDGPLDMRMDQGMETTASDWLASAGEKELEHVLREYGEERYARRIARAIARHRALEPISRTSQLASIVAAAIPRWERGQHPATRSFQAIRVHINRELQDLQAGLMQSTDELRAGGRLVVISFHSLEDRIVKRFMRDESRCSGEGRRLPTASVSNLRLRRIGRAYRPEESEVHDNPRARSAVLRVAERI